MRYKPGDKIGVFTLIEYVGHKKWKAQCKCGHIWERTPSRFKIHLDFCRKCDKVDSNEAQKRWRENNPKNLKWVDYRSRCKKINRAFELSREQFYDLLGQPCHYCGDISNCGTLDRKDSKAGYTLDNVLPACYLCNMMKRDLTPEAFLNQVNKIAAATPSSIREDSTPPCGH